MIEIVPETGSTNADLIARLRGGEKLAEGDWLMAERQTGGKGRLGRVWESPAGNLHCSTVVQLNPGDPPATTLSFMAGLAVFDCVKRCLFNDTPMLLKWPNDLLVFEGKIAGILLERHAETVVVGIGINVSHAPEIPGRKTETIAYANGKFANGPGKALDILAETFAARLGEWRSLPLSHTMLEWAIRSHRFNDLLRVTGAEGEAIHGSYRGLTPEGALRLQPIGAAECTIHAGDVVLGWHDEEEG